METRTAPPEFYANDLAYVHDVGFGEFADASAPGLLDIMRTSGVTEGLVVDLGCGSGIWARHLLKAGYEVLGIDISPAMIALARDRAPAAEYHLGSHVRTEIPPCVAVTALGEVLNYLADEDNGMVALDRLFGRAFQSLAPGGLLIFDVAEPGRGRGSRQGHWSGPDWVCLVEREEDSRTQRLTRRITTFRRFGESWRRRDETHVAQLYEGSAVVRLLRDAGFRVRVMRGYGAKHFPQALVGFIARKPHDWEDAV